MTSRSQLQELRLAVPLTPDAGDRVVIVYPDEWPAEVQATYRSAEDTGDTERQFQVIEQQTGTRPSRNPEALVIAFVTRPDGPQ